MPLSFFGVAAESFEAPAPKARRLFFLALAFGLPGIAFGVVDGADHGGGFEEFAVVDEAGVAGAGEFGEEAFFEVGFDGGVGGVVGEVLGFVGVFFEVVEFVFGAFAVDGLVGGAPLGVVAHADEPGFGGAGIVVGVGGAGVGVDFFWGGGAGAVEAIGVAEGPAVGAEIDDEEVVGGVEGTLGVGGEVGAGVFDVAFAAGDDPGALGVDEAGFFGFEDGPEAAAGHDIGDGEAGGFEEGGAEVGEADEVVDDAAALDAGAGEGEADAGAEAVEVAFAVREAGSAVVAGDGDEGVVEHTGFFEFGDVDADSVVPGGDFAEVVGEVFADFGDVGEVGGHFAFEIVGIDVPEFFAAALGPGAVDIGGAEPVAEGFVVFVVGEEGAEVGADFGVEFFFGGFEGGAVGDEFGDVLGELVEAGAGGLVGVGLLAVGGVGGGAGAPDFVGFADVVAGVFEEEGVGGDFFIPDGAAEDGAATGAPEVLAGEEGAAAGGAGGGVDMGVTEEDAFFGDLVEVGGADDVVDAAWAVDFGVDAGVAAPVVGEEEEDVGFFVGGCGGQGEEDGEEQGEEVLHRGEALKRRWGLGLAGKAWAIQTLICAFDAVASNA